MREKEFNDQAAIQRLQNEKLALVQSDKSGWITLYRDAETGRFWELDYPHSERHGGGPARLRELDINDVADWAFSTQPIADLSD